MNFFIYFNISEKLCNFLLKNNKLLEKKMIQKN